MDIDEDVDEVWVTRLSRIFVSRSPLGALPTILLSVGSIPFILTGVFFVFIGLDVRRVFIGSQLLAALLSAVGPALIWRYENNIFMTFIQRATEVTPHEDNRALQAIAVRYRSFFSDVAATTGIWTVLLLWALVANLEYFASLGVTGYTDPAFLVYGLFAVWTAVITAVGIRMAVTTILCIREIGALEFSIDPLHPDGLGGLSTIGYFAIRTTTLLSFGALALPIAFDVVRAGDGSVIVYLAVAVYIGLIIGSFAFPTIYINRRANEIKRSIMNSKRERIHELQSQLLAGDNPENLETLQMKLEELRTEHDAYDSVSLYPLSLSIISRLVSSVFLPLFFAVVETYVI